jgi:hypothetical protein
MLRRLVMAAVVTAMVPLGAMLTPASASAATTAACTGGVALTQFAFNSASVPAGSSAPLTLVLQNCTSQPISGSTDWYGYYLDSTGNRPPGCGVIGPITFNFSIAAAGTYTLTNTFGSPPAAAASTCQPAALQISTTLNVLGSVSSTSASAFLQFAPACNDGVGISQFSFNPQTVISGQTSTATLVVQNCGSQAITGTTIWSGQFAGSPDGTPQGCPAATDPVSFAYSIAPGGTFTQAEQEGVTIPGCQASAMKWTVSVTVNLTPTLGVVAATAQTSLSVVPPTGPPPSVCHVAYSPSPWAGGLTANVTINNTGSAAISNWTLTFAFEGDQKIANAWNATVSQSGQNVTAANESYNATIPAGGSQSFGFQGTWTSSDAPPLVFFLNGTVCN